MKISFKPESININGSEIPYPLTTNSLEEIFGKPDETHMLHNTIRVWNGLGIYYYTKPNSPVVHDISFGFLPEDFEFYPDFPYNGTLTFNSNDINKDSEIKTLLKCGFKKDDILPSQFILEKESIEVYIEVNRTTLSSASFSIKKVK